MDADIAAIAAKLESAGGSPEPKVAAAIREALGIPGARIEGKHAQPARFRRGSQLHFRGR